MAASPSTTRARRADGRHHRALERHAGLKDPRRLASLMHAYMVVSLMAGVRPEEARAIGWEEDVDLDGNPPSVAVLRVDRDLRQERSVSLDWHHGGDEQVQFPPFPVKVTRLPVTRCQICRRTVAYRPGSLSEVLTEHYRRVHPEALGLPSR
jgi:hypothetical protein